MPRVSVGIAGEAGGEGTATGGEPPAAGTGGREGGILKGEGEGQGVASGGDGNGGVGPSEGLDSDVIPPNPIHFSVPTIPRGVDPARARGARVKLLILVDKTGEVAEVNLLSSSGLALLDKSAEETALRLRYAPGLRAGVPTGMWTQAEISF